MAGTQSAQCQSHIVSSGGGTMSAQKAASTAVAGVTIRELTISSEMPRRLLLRLACGWKRCSFPGTMARFQDLQRLDEEPSYRNNCADLQLEARKIPECSSEFRVKAERCEMLPNLQERATRCGSAFPVSQRLGPGRGLADRRVRRSPGDF